MVYNLGPKSLQWSLLGGGGAPRVVVFFTHDILIDTSEQRMCQRDRIMLPGVFSSAALQAYNQIKNSHAKFIHFHTFCRLLLQILFDHREI